MTSKSSKKTFKEDLQNPAMQFISPPIEQQQAAAEPPEGYHLNPKWIETKSARLHLLVRPTLHAKVKARAKAEGSSVNDYVHRILEAAVADPEA